MIRSFDAGCLKAIAGLRKGDGEHEARDADRNENDVQHGPLLSSMGVSLQISVRAGRIKMRDGSRTPGSKDSIKICGDE